LRVIQELGELRVDEHLAAHELQPAHVVDQREAGVNVPADVLNGNVPPFYRSAEEVNT
jgi:hypothetical protein